MPYDKLHLVNPSFDSEVTRLVVELESYRRWDVHGTTPPWLFYELKDLFQSLESIFSVRIEGNHTTIAEYVESVRADRIDHPEEERIREIVNLENGLDFIESNRRNLVIDKEFVCHLHRMVVEGLSPQNEGDDRPGAYRNAHRSITGSSHSLPQHSDVSDLMDELLSFINHDVRSNFDMIKVAIAHHRFVWIHPFGNGNGRTVRLLTYAMLAKQGFISDNQIRVLSPAAFFGRDRNQYNQVLAAADDGSEAGLVNLCEYVLSGIKTHMDNVKRLSDGEFTHDNIITPALDYALDKRRINETEYKMLKIAADKGIVQASDFAGIFPGVTHVNISKAIRKLRDQNLLAPLKEKSRKYTLRLNRNTLTLGVIIQLDHHGFLPIRWNE